MMFGEIIAAALRQWPLFVKAVVVLLIARYWVVIDAARTYGFTSALLHGTFWYQNVVLSLFSDRVYYAPLNTGLSYWAGFTIGMIALPLVIWISSQVIIALYEARRS